jgi:hypothetical protein
VRHAGRNRKSHPINCAIKRLRVLVFVEVAHTETMECVDPNAIPVAHSIISPRAIFDAVGFHLQQSLEASESNAWWSKVTFCDNGDKQFSLVQFSSSVQFSSVQLHNGGSAPRAPTHTACWRYGCPSMSQAAVSILRATILNTVVRRC